MIGKWVYLIDAYDDIKEDLENNSYNPIIYQYKFDRKKESVEEFKNRVVENTHLTLIWYLSEASNALDLLELKRNKDIIENILFLGLRKKTDEVLEKGN